MASTGALVPENYNDVSSKWSDESYVTTDDTNFATVSTPKMAAYYLDLYRRTTLPVPSSTGTIVGVEVVAHAKVSNTYLSLDAKLGNMADEGEGWGWTEYGNRKEVTFSGTTEVTKTFGGSTDMWGVTAANLANVNGVRIWFFHSRNETYTGSIDYLTINVYYTSNTFSTMDGLAVSGAIKDINGLAIASVKSVIGVGK